MASRSSSRSDGEVLSSDSDAKATKSLSSRNNTNIDRHTRPYPIDSQSPGRRPRRHRSRSPYRAPRGEKRRREDDHDRDHVRTDPRTSDLRYDDRHRHSRQSSQNNHRSKRSRTHSRSRSRSRSPYRRPNVEEARSHADRGVREKSRYEGSVYKNVQASDVTQSGDTKDSKMAEPNAGKSKKSNKSSLATTAAEELGTVRNTKERHTADDLQTSSSDAAFDEAALIEARRKRREAIKSRYRSQATPLLVQALHTDAGLTPNEPSTEASTPRRSESPVPSSPGTPGTLSEPQSPADINVERDQDLPDVDNDSPHDGRDGPSAADYDPTIDMQEERARHDKRMFKESEEDQIRADQQVLKQSVAVGSPPPQEQRPEFDMFADDEDDMFAEAPLVSQSSTVEKAAQALDVGMMDNWDDAEGYYITILSELIESRYHVTQNLGRGMFSSVVRATDSTTNQPVAIKIVRNNETMRKAGIKEIDILKDIGANDPEDKKHIIRLYRSFDHKGHLCMVFENLSMNLREVLKKFGRDVGINMKAIRAYAQQLFLGLSLLKKCQYLHADLKPDNILVNEARNTVKICDLGSASPVTENATAPYLVSRFYRAPEVILGIPYDHGIDIWSVGCTLFELYTGKILFTGRNNNNMLRAIMECRGKFPHKLLRRGTLSHEYFDDLLNFRAIETDQVTGRMVTKMIDIKAKPVRDLRSRLMPKGKRMDEQERREVDSFLDLLEKCLDLRPDKRITPNAALAHPFVMRTK